MAATFHRVVDGLVYRTANPADIEPAWQLMLTQFFPRNPLYDFLGMAAPGEVEASYDLLPDMMACGASLIVEDPATGQIVASSMSAIKTVEQGSSKHPLVADPAVAARFPKDGMIYRMLDKMSADVDLFKLYGNSALAIQFLVVNGGYAGRGIARRMVEFSLEIAKDLRLQQANVYTGNKYSERIFNGLGFDKINEVKVSEFVDPVTNTQPFARLDKDLLESVVLYAKRL